VGWDKLKELEVPVGFVMGKDPWWTKGEENTQEMVWRAKDSRHERFMDAGHLVSSTYENTMTLSDEVIRSFRRSRTSRQMRSGGSLGVPCIRMERKRDCKIEGCLSSSHG
jgi:hypothetical protein